MSDTKTIWITGAKGYLGSQLVKRLTDAEYRVVGTDVELSVGEPERLEAFAEELQPDAIINCAGIPRAATGLSNRIKAYEVNALGARNMALVANTIGAHFIQISSDDVYASRTREPVNEFDSPHPDTPYGKSKRAGEMMVKDTMPDHLIVRASWLYHAQGGRLGAVLKAAAEGTTYKARTDQFAAPISIASYARILDKCIQKRVTGVLHVACRGEASRYDLAAKALEICGYEPGKVLVPETDLVTAERIILESLMLEMFGADLPTWQEDLEKYLKDEGFAK